jgi:sugar transferase (PEP-CTERM/EpsH1 system associated)
MKPALLFLAHRIPYPPNKGDKIRSYHLLRYLSSRYRIYLGTFIDDPSDWQNTDRLEKLCEECLFLDLNPLRARLKSVSGLITGDPLSVPYYYNSEMAEWVKAKVRNNGVDQLMAYSSVMAQYALAPDHGLRHRVIDFVDIDSDKWRQYAARKKWPMNWIYRREADYLFEFEKRVAEQFDASLFVSSAEAQMFRGMVGEDTSSKIDFYNNGVDIEYFSPEPSLQNPYGAEEKPLVFTGAMDYWPNIDAVCWFGKEIFPEILRLEPHARLYIVGGNPAESVLQLQNQQGIKVTGRVDDVRPYIKHAEAAIAPMRIARGVQNKVLEAMAMGKPTVVTPQGLEGIDAQDGKEVLVADDASGFVERILSVFNRERSDLGDRAKELIHQACTWDDVFPKLDKWFPAGR